MWNLYIFWSFCTYPAKNKQTFASISMSTYGLNHFPKLVFLIQTNNTYLILDTCLHYLPDHSLWHLYITNMVITEEVNLSCCTHGVYVNKLQFMIIGMYKVLLERLTLYTTITNVHEVIFACNQILCKYIVTLTWNHLHNMMKQFKFIYSCSIQATFITLHVS